MPARTRQKPLRIGDRARSKLNRRVGTVDAIGKIKGQRRYGLRYREAPRDQLDQVMHPIDSGAD